MATIFIHCGLHKTGTTSLQRFLAEHSELLRSCNFLFPRTGRLERSPGHHNIAWQIARDRRFQLTGGNTESLLAEIAAFDGNVILSSEDFESSIGNSERWSAFLKKLRLLGRSIVVIVYLRSQTGYLESLYQENLKHGCGDEFWCCAQKILSDGTIRYNDQIFHFNYLKLALSLMRHQQIDIIFRNFHALTDNSLARDFFSVVGVPASVIKHMEIKNENKRDTPLVSLRNFYRNRVCRKLAQCEVDALGLLGNEILHAPTASSHFRRLTTEKFAPGNARLCEQFPIARDGLLSQEPAAYTPVCDMERFFSFETQTRLQEISRLMQAPAALKASPHRQQAIGKARLWWDWVLASNK
jgi:hypothetical protein